MMDINRQKLIVLATAVVGSVLALAGGCSDDIQYINLPNDTSDNIEVTLSVEVLSWPTGLPVAEASYEVIQTGLSGKTGSDGFFTAQGLHLGTYQVLVSAPGYYGTRLALSVDPGEKTQERHLHKTIYLMQPVGRVELLVLDQDQGLPLSGVPVTLLGCTFPESAEDQFLHQPYPQAFDVSDTSGSLSMTGLPSGHLNIRIGGLDTDGDGIMEYLPATLDTQMGEGLLVNATVALEFYSPETQLSLVATNLPAEGKGITAESLFFVFSDSMDTSVSTTTVLFTQDNSPYTQVALTTVWTSPMRLELMPQAGLLGVGVDYDIDLLVSSKRGHQFQQLRRFYWLQPLVSENNDCEGTVSGLRLLNDTALDFNTQEIQLAWTAVPCAQGYDIYLKDDLYNPAWVYYGFNADDFDNGEISQNIDLFSSFDRFQADDIQTPFAGTNVSVCVVPRKAVDQTPGNEHAVIVLSDVTDPSIKSASAGGLFNNLSDEDQTSTVEIIFSEYLSPDNVDPVLEIREAGGDAGVSLDPATAIWIWNSGMMSGRFEITINSGVNVSGDEYRVSLADATDQSGNTVSGGLFSEWKVLPSSQLEWFFETGPGGWVSESGRWQWGSPTDGPRDGHDGGYCWGTGLDQYYSNYWDESLVSPFLILPETNPHIEFYAYDDFQMGDFWELIIEDNGVKTTLSHVTNDTDAWRLIGFSLSEFANKPVRIIFRFVTDESYTDSGVFIDEVRVFEN